MFLKLHYYKGYQRNGVYACYTPDQFDTMYNNNIWDDYANYFHYVEFLKELFKKD